MPSRRARATIIRVFCFYSVNTSARGKTGFAVFSGNNSEQSQKKNSSLCKGSMLAVITGPINTQLKKGSIIEDVNSVGVLEYCNPHLPLASLRKYCCIIGVYISQLNSVTCVAMEVSEFIPNVPST